MHRPVVAQQADRHAGAAQRPHIVEHAPRVAHVSRQHEMTDQHTPARQPVPVQGQGADLPDHLRQGRAVDGHVVPHLGKAPRRRVVAVLGIRRVDVHHAVQQSQRLHRVIPTAVVDQRQRQAALGGDGHRLQDLGGHMGRPHEIDGMAAPAL